MLLIHGHPPINPKKGTPRPSIIHQNGTMRIFKVSGYETPISLLSGGVPQLQLVQSIAVVDVFMHEVDADGGLH